jgi:hypothetical protein
MPTPVQFKAAFGFDHYYHLLFRSIDGIPLFTNQKQSRFFLEKFNRYSKEIFQCWAYSLLDNHAHFIIKVKPEELVKKKIIELSVDERTKAMIRLLEKPGKEFMLFDEVAERQINRFMVSYANTYNNFSERKGGVFQQPFRRSLIAEETHLLQAVIYVHANAQKHQLFSDFKDHPFNSYQEILSGDSILIDSKILIDFFGGKENYINLHKEQVAYFYTNQWPSSKLEID